MPTHEGQTNRSFPTDLRPISAADRPGIVFWRDRIR